MEGMSGESYESTLESCFSVWLMVLQPPATKKAVARIMEESVNRIAITQGILSYSLTRLKPEEAHSAIESPSA